MSDPAAKSATLPPKSRGTLWFDFAKWVLGIPLLVGGALGLIWLAYWATGGSIMPQTEMNIGTVIFWLVVIAILYPAMIWVWSMDLRDGMKALREWEAMGPDERAAALAAQPAPKPKRKRRSKA